MKNCVNSIIKENASLEQHDDNAEVPVVPLSVAGWEPLVCTDPIGMYIFTVSEPVRLDTGSEYVTIVIICESDQQV